MTTKAAAPANEVQKITVSIPSIKGSYEQAYDNSAPAKFAGEVVNMLKGQEFSFNGLTIKVPGESAANDKVLRSFGVLTGLVNATFAGSDADTIFEPDTKQGQFCEGLKAAGFKLAYNSKASAKTAVKLWYDAKKATVKHHILATQELNVEKMARIKAANDANRETAGRIKSTVKTFLLNSAK